MGNNQDFIEIIAEIYQSVIATPKKQRRLLSKTFWGKFGFKSRTKERIEHIRNMLNRQGLILNLDETHFGTENKNDWIIISYVDPVLPTVLTNEAEPKSLPEQHLPSDSWFQMMENRSFESEREVEYYFIVPLLNSLGYEEEDFAIGYPIVMFEGVTKVKKEIDFAIFNGSSREKKDALLIVEAKKSNKTLTEDAIGQAKGYAIWLTAPFYLITNADEILLYLSRAGLQPDLGIMKFQRSELRKNWATLYLHINKSIVMERKEKLGRIFAASGM